jgi:hypothetical protein
MAAAVLVQAAQQVAYTLVHQLAVMHPVAVAVAAVLMLPLQRLVQALVAKSRLLILKEQ